jgi:hypothetical protein
MQKEETKTQDLGFANGWSTTPEIVKNCPHKVENVTVGRALVKSTCTVCNYHFLSDSSD